MITDEQLDEKRQRNAEAEAELRRLENERVERETGTARQQTADHLDAEYARIQALVDRAKALNDAGDDVDAVAEAATVAATTAVAPVVPPTAPRRGGSNSTVADEDGDDAPGEGK